MRVAAIAECRRPCRGWRKRALPACAARVAAGRRCRSERYYKLFPKESLMRPWLHHDVGKCTHAGRHPHAARLAAAVFPVCRRAA